MKLYMMPPQDQAATVFGYPKAFLEASPVLRRENRQRNAHRDRAAEWHCAGYPCCVVPLDARSYVDRRRARRDRILADV
jgi:hypothetical protein